ncbi:MAG: Ig-like domain-containing protein, partial [Armatimonadetes bacterium]|nr:Ig-like domain-containing protein [Armatimonadota bacterium]
LQNVVTTTNEVGEATAELISTTNHETATITVESGTVVGYGYAEFAHPGDPHIRILEPAPGTNLSGTAVVRAEVYDTDADGSDEIVSMTLYVDGAIRGSITTNDYYPSGVDTWRLSNGPHTLSASATDSEGNTMWSQRVSVNVYNSISEVSISPTELFSDEPDQGNITISGRLNEAGTWNVQITDMSGNTVFADSGSEGAFQSAWDGKVSGNYIDGLYRATLTKDSTTHTTAITISAAHAPVFISGLLRGEEQWSRDATIDEMEVVMDACRAQYARFTAIADPLWSTGIDPEQNRVRKGLCDWLKDDYRYWFHTGHGEVRRLRDSLWHAMIMFPDVGGTRLVCGNDYWALPAERPFIRAFSDIGVWTSQYHIVMINACWSGGSWLQGYDQSIPNAFGNYGAVEIDQTYLGWGTKYYPGTLPIFQYLQPNGTGWTKEFWRRLGMGYTVSQAHWWANMDTTGWMHNFLCTYGGPDVTYFDPW